MRLPPCVPDDLKESAIEWEFLSPKARARLCRYMMRRLAELDRKLDEERKVHGSGCRPNHGAENLQWCRRMLDAFEQAVARKAGRRCRVARHPLGRRSIEMHVTGNAKCCSSVELYRVGRSPDRVGNPQTLYPRKTTCQSCA